MDGRDKVCVWTLNEDCASPFPYATRSLRCTVMIFLACCCSVRCSRSVSGPGLAASLLPSFCGRGSASWSVSPTTNRVKMTFVILFCIRRLNTAALKACTVARNSGIVRLLSMMCFEQRFITLSPPSFPSTTPPSPHKFQSLNFPLHSKLFLIMSFT